MTDSLMSNARAFDNVVFVPMVPATILPVTSGGTFDVSAIVRSSRKLRADGRRIIRQLRTTDSGQVIPKEADVKRRSSRLPKPFGYNTKTGNGRLPDARLRPTKEGDVIKDDSYGRYHGTLSDAFHFVQSVELAKRQERERNKARRLARRNRAIGENTYTFAPDAPRSLNLRDCDTGSNPHQRIPNIMGLH